MSDAPVSTQQADSRYMVIREYDGIDRHERKLNNLNALVAREIPRLQGSSPTTGTHVEEILLLVSNRDTHRLLPFLCKGSVRGRISCTTLY